MSAPLIVVVLLGPYDPNTEAMLASARGALSDATVIADTSGATADSDALAIAESAHARAVAVVSWRDTEHAHLHVHLDTWADDDLAFSPNDPPSEKGRAVGFTLASMVQRLDASAPPPPSAPTPVAEVPVVVPPPPPEPPARPHRFAAFALGAGAVGGAASAGGGAIGARWTAPFGFGARVAGGLLAGPVADGHSVTVELTGGPTYGVMIAGTIEVGARVDVSAMHLAIVRDDASRSRWLGATALVAEAALPLGHRLAITVGIGPELAFGATNVRANGAEVAHLPRWRAVGEAGVRIEL